MKLEVRRSLTGGIFKVDMYFKSYEVFEEGLIEDFGAPVLTIPVGQWTADAAVAGETVTISGITNGAAKDCDIEITKEIKVNLDSSFSTSFEVNIADLSSGDQAGQLNSLILVALGKCQLFVDLVKQEAKKEMDKLRALRTGFESSINTPVIIKV